MTLVEFVGSNLIECENELLGVRSAEATSISLTLTLSPFPVEFELNRKVNVRLNPMNLETSKHSSVAPQPTGGVPALTDGGPPVIGVCLILVMLKMVASLVPL